MMKGKIIDRDKITTINNHINTLRTFGALGKECADILYEITVSTDGHKDPAHLSGLIFAKMSTSVMTHH
jgi:hypothetical protein